MRRKMRARNIKPGFFENEELSSLDPYARLLFIGLWMIADRDGRFEWRPKRIKALVFPYDDIDITCHLMSLHAMTLILQYNVDESLYGWIPNFKKHQNPHPHEPKSVIPEPHQMTKSGIITKNVIFSKTENDEQIQCHGMSLHVTKCNADIMNPESYITPYSPSKTEPRHFDTFWKAYPKKVGKGAAEKAWKKIRQTDETISAILAAVERQKQSEQWQQAKGKFIPHPATWLNQRRWEDETACEPQIEYGPEEFPAIEMPEDDDQC